MEDINKQKCSLLKCEHFLNYLISYSMCDPAIITKIQDGSIKANISERVNGAAGAILLDAKTGDDDTYTINIGDGPDSEICLMGDTAFYTIYLNNETIYYTFELNGDKWENVLHEEVSTKSSPMRKSQISLLQGIKEALNINAIGFDRVIYPDKESCQKEIYPNEYQYYDKVKNIHMCFQNNDGWFVFGISYNDNKSLVQIRVQDDEASISLFDGKNEASYEECELSEETKSALKKIVKALIDNDIDVSELPVELTDQSQYSS